MDTLHKGDNDADADDNDGDDDDNNNNTLGVSSTYLQRCVTPSFLQCTPSY